MKELENILMLEELEMLGIPSSCVSPYIDAFPEPLPDLCSLKKNYIEKAICHLYGKLTFNFPIRVALFTWVMGDGLGDFSAQIETAKALLSIPQIDLSLISLHPKRMPLSPASLNIVHIFIPYQENEKGTWEDIPPVPIPADAQSLLQKAHVIFQLPTYFPYTKELLDPILQNSLYPPSYELLGEGGWGATPRFSPQNGGRSLGLRSWEKGLFFPKLSLKQSFFQDLLLKTALEKTSPSKLCLGYVRNPASCLLLAKTFITMKEKDPSDLTLCLFPSEALITELPSLKDFLKSKNIRTVHIYYEGNFIPFPLQEKGKILSLIQTKKLSRQDYQNLILQSDCLVGCRGDGSLSETLSADKIPFFDFPAHKRPLLEGLVSIARNKLGSFHETFLYLQEFLLEIPSFNRLASLANNPKTSLGFSLLFSFLQEHFSAYDFVKNLTLRAAYHHFHPEVSFFEAQIFEPFFLGEKKAVDALQELQALLEKALH